jgi:hypothetical protein
VSAFNLSPGITPLLTDLFVVELPIAVGLGLVLRGRAGAEIAFALNALALGAIKLVTDYGDRGDWPIIAAALVGGALGLLAAGRAPKPSGPITRMAALLVGLGVVGVAAVKILRDFYDPFDVLLADAAAVTGFALIARALGARPLRERPAPSGAA